MKRKYLQVKKKNHNATELFQQLKKSLLYISIATPTELYFDGPRRKC